MAILGVHKEKIDSLKRKFEQVRRPKEALLQKIDEAEIPESVYNSNAIENSTLTLKETERILLEMEADRDITCARFLKPKIWPVSWNMSAPKRLNNPQRGT